MPRRVLTRGFWDSHRGTIGYLILTAGVVAALAITRNQDTRLREQAAAGAQSHAAVCALRADLEQRVASGEAFLRSHPTGAFGLTAKVIHASILNEQKTISALAVLRCP